MMLLNIIGQHAHLLMTPSAEMIFPYVYSLGCLMR
jgi:hypothetical protein